MNACLVFRIVEQKLGLVIFLGNRVIGLHSHSPEWLAINGHSVSKHKIVSGINRAN